MTPEEVIAKKSKSEMLIKSCGNEFTSRKNYSIVIFMPLGHLDNARAVDGAKYSILFKCCDLTVT